MAASEAPQFQQTNAVWALGDILPTSHQTDCGNSGYDKDNR
jgi:hypothetical protein